ncbi:hypothetical protein VTL71DRAFT_7712 [Oculimacula yallundae]|uniref:Uncharacterized protein n=1 Tax=Oculimacula yallundae TaxID=86028 RepID=A0ABR4BUX5_9HELO
MSTGRISKKCIIAKERKADEAKANEAEAETEADRQRGEKRKGGEGRVSCAAPATVASAEPTKGVPGPNQPNSACVTFRKSFARVEDHASQTFVNQASSSPNTSSMT